MKKLIKKVIPIFLAFVMLFGTIVVKVNASETVDFCYKINSDNSIIITGYNGSEQDLFIPSEIDGHKVIAIDENAFSNNNNIISVTIEDGIKAIYDFAFINCENLATINIPDSVISLSSNTFNNTNWYNNQPNGVIYIGKVLYSYKGNYESLQSLEIKEGTKSVAFNALGGCTKLSDIYVPDSVIYIAPLAFSSTAWYENHSDGEIYAGKILYGYKGDLPKNAVINVKSDTLGISGGAFRYSNDSENLKEILLPDGLKTIGWGAFINCRNLYKLTIPNSVEFIDKYAYGYLDKGKVVKGDKDLYTIYGYSDTEAERYAYDYDINFNEINVIDYSKYNPFEFLGMSFDEITNIFGNDYTKVEERESGLHKIICYPDTGNPFEFGFDNDTDLVKCIWIYDLTEDSIKLFDDITNKSTLEDMKKSTTSFTYSKWVGENVFDDNNIEQNVTYKLNDGITVSFEWTSNDFNKQPANRVLVMQGEVEGTTSADTTVVPTTTKSNIKPTSSTNATSLTSTADTATSDSVNNDNGTIQTGVISISVIVALLLASLATGGFAWYRRKIK